MIFNILIFPKILKYCKIEDIINISNVSKKFNKNSTKSIKLYKLFIRVKCLDIKQGCWSPYCTIRDIQEYSLEFWENFLNKNPLEPTFDEVSIINSFILSNISLSIKTYGLQQSFKAIVYPNGLIKQLPTTGGFLYYENYIEEHTIEITTIVYKNNPSKNVQVLYEPINISTHIIEKILSNCNRSNWLLNFYSY